MGKTSRRVSSDPDEAREKNGFCETYGHSYGRGERSWKDDNDWKTRHKMERARKSVVLAAGDTFRAAAVAQLEVGKRVGCEVVKGKEGAD